MSLAERLLGWRDHGEQVRPDQAAELIKSGAMLLDVREPYEWQTGHAPMAKHIPLGQLPARTGELPAGCQLIVACRSGHRSARAAALLADRGWAAVNLAGGMRSWVRSGLPVVATGGRTGTVA